MTYAIRIIVSTLTLLASLPHSAASPEGSLPSWPSQVLASFDGVDADEQRVDEAFGLFADVGFGLADLELRFHRNVDDCGGRDGFHRYSSGEHLVVLCNPDASYRSVTLLHELAHVWIAQNVDDSTRSAFMEFRGLVAWNDRDRPWGERATEHAAEIVAWGLGDRPCSVLPNALIGNRNQADLAKGFELLTGLEAGCTAQGVPGH